MIACKSWLLGLLWIGAANVWGAGFRTTEPAFYAKTQWRIHLGLNALLSFGGKTYYQNQTYVTRTGAGLGWWAGVSSEHYLGKKYDWSWQPMFLAHHYVFPYLNSQTFQLQIPLLFKWHYRTNWHFFAGPSVLWTWRQRIQGVSPGEALYPLALAGMVGVEWHFHTRWGLEMSVLYNPFRWYNPDKVTYADLRTKTINGHSQFQMGLIFKFKRPFKGVVLTEKVSEVYMHSGNNLLTPSQVLELEDDNDGDGVPYYRDVCPNEKGSVSNNGCPLELDKRGKPLDKDTLSTLMPQP